MSERYLIVGLGNPGREYANTRHNIGFRCVNALARTYGLDFDKKQAKARLASGTIEGRAVLLARPQTYMNLSGDAVSALASFYKIPPEHVLVIYDDLDLPLGTLRLRKSGGSGGHKGIQSIIQRLGTQDFPRLRFGINRPPDRMDPAAYVLRPFAEHESALVARTIDRAVQAVATWLREGIESAMTRYNGPATEATPDQEAAPPPPESRSDAERHATP